MPQLGLSERLAGLYGGAVASVRLRDFARADRAVQAGLGLLKTAPGSVDAATGRTFVRLAAQLALARGDVAQAGQALDISDPVAGATTRTGLLLRADWALADRSAVALRQSSEALQIWLAVHRDDAAAWQALAQAEEQQGQRLRALRAAAESQAALGNLPGAIDRLRAGQRVARQGGPGTDFIEASVIDSRLRDLLTQRRQLLAEERRERGASRSTDPNGEPGD
jgi:predicted Zn-dependent protease